MCEFCCKLLIFTCYNVLSNSWFVFVNSMVNVFLFSQFSSQFHFDFSLSNAYHYNMKEWKINSKLVSKVCLKQV